MLEKAQKKLDAYKERTEVTEGHEDLEVGAGKQEADVEPVRNKNEVVENVANPDHLKNWIVESMALILEDTGKACQMFHLYLEKLVADSPKFVGILESLNVGDPVDFGAVSAKIRDIEHEQRQILADLQSLGKPRRRPGRPFGARNKVIAEPSGDLEDKGVELTPEKAVRNKRRTKPKDSKDAEAGNGEGGDEPAEPSRDPFAELEEKKEPNKCALIPLYVKCMVVEFARKLQSEDTVANIEKEVMLQYKKYFWNPDSGRWKTGLLSKWTKFLDFFPNTLVSIFSMAVD